MHAAAHRQPVVFAVEDIETEPLDDAQREHGVNALATLINSWNETRRSTQTEH